MNNAYNWYQTLIKPSWAPPSWVFGPVWTVLYIIIAISFGFVFYKVLKGQLPWYVGLPFLLNLVFNFIFTPIQFGLKNNLLATVDILLVLGTLVWALTIIIFYPLKKHIEAGTPVMPWVAIVNIPYLLWVCIATILQMTITYLNWGK